MAKRRATIGMVLERLDQTDASVESHFRLLLGHMQGMKSELKQDIKGLGERIGGVENKVMRLEQKVNNGFEDARKHREALQEDLNATIGMVGKHQRKLARL